MLPDLSAHLHTPECNDLIQQLFSCHKENYFGKYVGLCDSLDTQVWKCLKRERLEKRRLNKIDSDLRQEALKKRFKENKAHLQGETV